MVNVPASAYYKWCFKHLLNYHLHTLNVSKKSEKVEMKYKNIHSWSVEQYLYIIMFDDIKLKIVLTFK